MRSGASAPLALADTGHGIQAFARRQALQPRAVDIGALIDGLVDLMRRSLGPSIAVTLEIPRHLSSARVDPNQLELALLNLAINARDAMPGGGKLTLTVTEVVVDDRNMVGLAPDRYVRIAAIDTGALPICNATDCGTC